MLEPLINTDTLAATPAANPSASAPAAPNADASQQQPNQQQQPAIRPDFLPEALWDTEKNAPKTDEVLKQFGELSKFKTDYDAKLATVPAKAEDYALPEKIDDEEIAKLIPAGQEISIDAKNPMIAAFREFAFANKLPQEMFTAAVQTYLKQQVLEEKAFADASEAETKKLGGNGLQRKEAVKTFLVSVIGEADTKEILGSVYSAKQFEAFERLQAKYSGSNILPLSQQRHEPAPAEKTFAPGERLYNHPTSQRA